MKTLLIVCVTAILYANLRGLRLGLGLGRRGGKLSAAPTFIGLDFSDSGNSMYVAIISSFP